MGRPTDRSGGAVWDRVWEVTLPLLGWREMNYDEGRLGVVWVGYGGVWDVRVTWVTTTRLVATTGTSRSLLKVAVVLQRLLVVEAGAV